jgi:hypothetical protein
MLAATREDIKQIISGQATLKGAQLDRLFDSAARRIATYCLPHHLKWITEIPISVTPTDSQGYVDIPDGLENISAMRQGNRRVEIVSPTEFNEDRGLYTNVTSAYVEKACIMQDRIYIVPTPMGAAAIELIGTINPSYLDDVTNISGILDSMPDYYDGAMKSAILAEHSTSDPTRFDQHEAAFERMMLRNIEASKARGEFVGPRFDEQTERDFGDMSPGGADGYRYDTNYPDGYF